MKIISLEKVSSNVRFALLCATLSGCSSFGLGDTVDPAAAQYLHSAIQKEFDYMVKSFDESDGKGELELCAPKYFAVARFAVYQAIEERNSSSMEQMTRFIGRATRMLTAANTKFQSGKCVDSDGDGLTDLEEFRRYKTDAHNADTDGDGLSDGLEVRRYRTDPLRRDTDGDLLDDGEEVLYRRLSPRHPDSDGDGYTDGFEVARETDPRDHCSLPASGPRRPKPWRKCTDSRDGKKAEQAPRPAKPQVAPSAVRPAVFSYPRQESPPGN